MMAAAVENKFPWRDQIWLCEHHAVYTQGLAGKAEHLLNPGTIPVVQTNRGGQVTFHAPGQVIAYPLIDLKKAGYFVKEFVFRLEEAAIRTLFDFGITGQRIHGAPGIYVKLDDPFGHGRLEVGQTNGPLNFDGLGKIAALGIKVSNYKTYHGLALNASMDLEPYQRINPCGYQGLQTIDMASLGVAATWADVAPALAKHLVRHLTP
ncbi:lipoyl(octanoyl) transferase LipB [Curvibacter sp. CHRR-16]|uniref:lipoyl(octanoyl) transferase LipB n=1 Tax=Curvibacter sp. CHRR-16 TaxID=2835872 RepID=UPI002023A0DB|nr:lipoyl(octanoyl) transferase LipB [Curvibacter sp. CHRR-16]